VLLYFERAAVVAPSVASLVEVGWMLMELVGFMCLMLSLGSPGLVLFIC